MLVADVVPPLLYFWLWPLLGAFAVLLIVAWFVLVPLLSRLLTRTRPSTAVSRPRPAARGFAGTMAEIDEVERAALADEISVREAHLRLSELVRSYASEGRMYDARTMTLTELRDNGMLIVAQAVAQFYPIAFQEEELTELGPAPQIAREAVRAWN